MTERCTCPICDKPVDGRYPLACHLDYAHEVADPWRYLAHLEHPGPLWFRAARWLIAASRGPVVRRAVAMPGVLLRRG